MPARNCETRPVSWRTHRNKELAEVVQTEGYQVWTMWMGFLTHRDNLGYFDGGNGTLKDAFFPHDSNITLEKIDSMKRALHDKGLIILYEIESIEYVLVPKISNFNKLVGNLSDHTTYPAPPKDVITAWEQRTNAVYTPLIRCIDDVKTPYKHRTDGVRTEGKGKGQGKDKENHIHLDEKLINSRLGKIATKDMIKACLREFHPSVWWKIGKFLTKRYPSGGDRSFAEAEREFLKETRK
jgi:hypothetical protein